MGLICPGGASAESTERGACHHKRPHMPSSSGTLERSSGFRNKLHLDHPKRTLHAFTDFRPGFRSRSQATTQHLSARLAGQPSLPVHPGGWAGTPQVLLMVCQGCHDSTTLLHLTAGMTDPLTSSGTVTESALHHPIHPVHPLFSLLVKGACSQMGHCPCPCVKAIPLPSAPPLLTPESASVTPYELRCIWSTVSPNAAIQNPGWLGTAFRSRRQP